MESFFREELLFDICDSLLLQSVMLQTLSAKMFAKHTEVTVRMARKAGAIFFAERILLGSRHFLFNPSFFADVFCLGFRWSLEAGCSAKGPGAPLRGGGALCRLYRGRKWLRTAGGWQEKTGARLATT